jgi:hypothetical protein
MKTKPLTTMKCTLPLRLISLLLCSLLTLTAQARIVKLVITKTEVDPDGNELGGIRNTTLRVPLGTYTGWSLRRAGYGEGNLASLNGMFIPFKKTKAERLAANDPRPSLEERYVTHDAYVAAVQKAADDLVKAGFLLPDDAQEEICSAQNSTILP